MERNDFIEQILGGIFAVIAICAAIAELIINGCSAATIAAGIKDVFGTLVVVVLFLAVIKDNFPARNFKGAFDQGMNRVIPKYGSLVRKEEASSTSQTAETKHALAKRNKLEAVICYEMADNINVLFGTPCGNYKRFLEIETKTTTQVKLLVRKSFFDHPGFSEATLNTIGNNIKINLTTNFKDYKVEYDEKNHNVLINTDKVMKSKTDAIELAKLVDASIMLYIAESKK